ncbi:MAG: hypothetical protein JO122_17840 [Acetobacteraceae bacterium]|nr:hypothetical protein [Acetobacteraceae bacterium]
MNGFQQFSHPVWVNSGSSVGWWYTFHDNRGAQYAMANPQTPDGQMITTYEGNDKNEDGTITYYVGFQNNGPQPCFHNLNGGGLT